ncbi:MAG: dTDP-4-dehydrorhamnose 3,5-epimerase [Sedimentisphaerales bacterium]|nr:dTDP-4-dehydrorhamnose 3,5-epimerase [Sedimentisphaerales bacterium]
MQTEVEKTSIDGVVVVKPEVFEDERGFFMEVFRKDQFEQLGLPGEFVQLNHSASKKNVVRGLHFQWDPPMGKLMRVTVGQAFLVAVDIRKDSPTLGRWFGIEASEKNKIQLYAPPCFARGFAVLSDYAEIQYMCTGIYGGPKGESGVLWNDPQIGIDWPVKDPVLSDKDKNAQTLAEWLERPESENFKMP